MGILERGLAKISQFNLRRREQAVAALLKETKEAEKGFAAEAKRLAIPINDLNPKNYYEMLGLKYTTDQKAIKDAYFGLVKRYHPDVNKSLEATRKTTEINEAYAVLKDKKRKDDYDARSLKGTNKLGDEAERTIANALLKRYSELRNRDFKEFNERVSVPQYRDSIKAAIEEAADWNGRFNEAASGAFAKFRECGKEIKRIESQNRGLLRSEAGEAEKERLRENLVRIEGMLRAYQEAAKGLTAITDRVRGELSTEENNVAERLRRSVS